jgi:hypothetical protein
LEQGRVPKRALQVQRVSRARGRGDAHAIAIHILAERRIDKTDWR